MHGAFNLRGWRRTARPSSSSSRSPSCMAPCRHTATFLLEFESHTAQHRTTRRPLSAATARAALCQRYSASVKFDFARSAFVQGAAHKWGRVLAGEGFVRRCPRRCGRDGRAAARRACTRSPHSSRRCTSSLSSMIPWLRLRRPFR